MRSVCSASVCVHSAGAPSSHGQFALMRVHKTVAAWRRHSTAVRNPRCGRERIHACTHGGFERRGGALADRTGREYAPFVRPSRVCSRIPHNRGTHWHGYRAATNRVYRANHTDDTRHTIYQSGTLHYSCLQLESPRINPYPPPPLPHRVICHGQTQSQTRPRF